MKQSKSPHSIWLALIFISVSQLVFSGVSFADKVTIKKPTIDGYRVDWCREWASNCGRAAADRFCQKIGHRRATSKFSMDRDIGNRSPTMVINSGQICNTKGCDGFKSIQCEVRTATLNSPAKSIPKKDKKNSKYAIYDDCGGKCDSAVGHTLPAGTLNSYQSLADSAIRGVANDHGMNSNKLIRDIESKCGSNTDACHLEKKLTFLRNYLNQ